MLERLPDIIQGRAFYQELSRFIPQEVVDRTLDKPNFLPFLTNETIALLQALQVKLESGDTSLSEFEL